jgi:hypothetical protein
MDELPAAKETSRYQTYLVTCWQERDEVVEWSCGAFVWKHPVTAVAASSPL